MKLEINLDLNDIFADGDGDTRSISDMIKDDIMYQTKQYIRAEMRESFEKFLESEVKAEIYNRVKQTCEEIMLEVISTKELIFKAWPNEGMTIRDWVSKTVKEYSESSVHENMRNFIKKAAHEYVDTFKQQYDIGFATHIVNNMKQQGLLIKGAAKLLEGQQND
jgi:hypothetical protein